MTYYLCFDEKPRVKYLEDTSSNLSIYILSPFNFLMTSYLDFAEY